MSVHKDQGKHCPIPQKFRIPVAIAIVIILGVAVSLSV